MVYLPRPDYFEGILQLRGHCDEALEWVVNQVNKDGRAVITKEKKFKNGIDLYFSSQKYLLTLAKKLKSTFGGELKTTSTLHTHKKGDPLYRVTVLFRILPFKPGDTFTIRGKDVELLRVTSKAHVKEIKTGKKFFVDLDELMRAAT